MIAEHENLRERLADLEARFAFQDEQIGNINPQMSQHEMRLRAVEDALRRLRAELSALRSDPGPDPGTEPPPPHY
ncbi:MAG: SlyX family protein [Lysobacterales bacterium]